MEKTRRGRWRRRGRGRGRWCLYVVEEEFGFRCGKQATGLWVRILRTFGQRALTLLKISQPRTAPKRSRGHSPCRTSGRRGCGQACSWREQASGLSCLCRWGWRSKLALGKEEDGDGWKSRSDVGFFLRRHRRGDLGRQTQRGGGAGTDATDSWTAGTKARRGASLRGLSLL